MLDFNLPANFTGHLYLHPDADTTARLARIEAALTAATTAITTIGNNMTSVSQDLQSIKDDLTTANTSITNMRGDIGRLNDKIQNMSADAVSIAEVKTLAAEVAANAGAGDAEGGDPAVA